MITKNDYFIFRGVDLDIELKNTAPDNETKSAEIYIEMVISVVQDFIKFNFAPATIPTNNEAFKKALLYQIEYFLENGKLHIYNPNNLPIIAPMTYIILKNNGWANPL